MKHKKKFALTKILKLLLLFQSMMDTILTKLWNKNLNNI